MYNNEFFNFSCLLDVNIHCTYILFLRLIFTYGVARLPVHVHLIVISIGSYVSLI